MGDYVTDDKYQRKASEARHGKGRSEYGPAPRLDLPPLLDLVKRKRCKRRRRFTRIRSAVSWSTAWFIATALIPLLIIYHRHTHPELSGTLLRARLPRPLDVWRWMNGKTP